MRHHRAGLQHGCGDTCWDDGAEPEVPGRARGILLHITVEFLSIDPAGGILGEAAASPAEAQQPPVRTLAHVHREAVSAVPHHAAGLAVCGVLVARQKGSVHAESCTPLPERNCAALLTSTLVEVFYRVDPVPHTASASALPGLRPFLKLGEAGGGVCDGQRDEAVCRGQQREGGLGLARHESDRDVRPTTELLGDCNG